MDTVLIRWLGELVAHPHLRELYYRGIHDFESLKGADLSRLQHANGSAVSTSMRKCIISSWRAIWTHACGVGLKRPCAISTHILEFRLGGVHARIGSMRILRSIVNQRQQTAKPPRLYREANPDRVI